jgi:hypothetical protein
MPKSVRYARSSDRRMFSGLTSRWIKPPTVRERERARHLRCHPERLLDRERSLPQKAGAQCFAVDEVEHAIEVPIDLSRVPQPHGVRVVDRARNVDFA